MRTDLGAKGVLYHRPRCRMRAEESEKDVASSRDEVYK